jgi:hypothetical protein
MAASSFALACDALARERDRVFIQRVAADYNLNYEELAAKYLTCAESAIKVPKTYKKREPKSVTVVTDKPTKEPKAKAEKQCCTAQTSKKEGCKFSALKGEVFCKRHLKQAMGEEEPSVKKASKKGPDPVHTHVMTTETHADCDLCQSHGNPLDEAPVAFEVVTPHCGPVKPAPEPVPAPASVRDRLAAMLEEADASDDEEGSEMGCDEEDYEEED